MLHPKIHFLWITLLFTLGRDQSSLLRSYGKKNLRSYENHEELSLLPNTDPSAMAQIEKKAIKKPHKKRSHKKELYTYYEDKDLDSYGESGSGKKFSSSTPPRGYVDNDLDCDDHNNQLLSHERDEDCDGVYESDDCDDEDSFFHKDKNGDQVCDELQFFLTTPYHVQVKTGKDQYSYLTIATSNHKARDHHLLKLDKEDDDFFFYFGEKEDEDEEELKKKIAIFSSSRRGESFHLISQEKEEALQSSPVFPGAVSFGYQRLLWGAVLEPASSEGGKTKKDPIFKVKILFEERREREILEVDPKTKSCPQGLWCSEAFSLQLEETENLWLALDEGNPKRLKSSQNLKRRAILRLLKEIPE